MNGPIPHVMKVGVEVWRMPPRTRGARYPTDDLKECRALVEWIKSIRGMESVTFSNHPFDYNPNPHLGGKGGPCIMIAGQFTVWRVNPGDYVVYRPEGFEKRIEIVDKEDFVVDFTSV